MFHQTVESDITIVGGGLAGVCAAISAARLGKTVALINNRPVLGGNSSSEVRVWVVGATSHGLQRYARESGIIGELYVENQYRNPEGNPVHWDEVVMDAVRAEKNIRVFLNTDVRDITVEDIDGERLVTGVRGWTMGSETTTDFTSEYYLDCTGDGLVGYLAGADFRLGREASSEFGESWAPEAADQSFLGSTILFYTKDLGRPVKFVPPASTKDITTTPIPESRIIRSGDKGAHYWWIEWGGELDIVHDNDIIRDELRSVIFGIWDYIKNSGKFDAQNLDLEWVGSMPGKREYRRFIGDYTLTQNDILEQRDFDDAVAFGGWSIDLHPVEGMYATAAGAHQRYSDGIYGIPFRSYYSRNVANLLVAGRDISATHVAFGSTRVMATCAAGGEAAGTGASLAIDLGVRPNVIAAEHAQALRQVLLRQDASVFGVRNVDDADLARSARVAASSVMSDIDPVVFDPDASLEDIAVALDSDLAVLVPVDPALDSIEILIVAERDTVLEASLWTTGKPQNAVPIDQQLTTTVSVAGSPEAQWVTIPLRWAPAAPENVVIILAANEAVTAFRRQTRVAGALVLVHKPEADGDDNVAVNHAEPIIQWPAHPLRGSALRARLSPQTDAFAAERAVGGFQRPFGGPNMWVSAATTFAEPEWLALEWDAPQKLSTIRLVFDDNVDVELNTLHHHRTPEEIFPELVRDYVVQAWIDGEWSELASVTDNRRRQRVHSFTAVTSARVRVLVTASNGIAQARIVSVRAY